MQTNDEFERVMIETQAKRKKRNRNVIFAVLGFMVLFVILVNVVDDKPTSESAKVEETKAGVEKQSQEYKMEGEVQTPNNWDYNETVDQMTDKTKKFASCQSLNSVEFEFPYSGGSNLKLTLRSNGSKTDYDVYMRISKGQFMQSFNGDDRIKVRFDDQKAEYYNYSMASDGSTEFIFVSNKSKFIQKIKNANKLIVEATFYDEGSRQFDFDVSGLKWN